MPVIVGILVVVLTFYTLRGFTQASPAFLARLLKGWAGFLALGLGGLLMARGAIGLGLALGGAGLWLLGLRGGSFGGFRSAGWGASGVSRVRSAMIEMELDRSSGAIRGVILGRSRRGQATRSTDAAPTPRTAPALPLRRPRRRAPARGLSRPPLCRMAWRRTGRPKRAERLWREVRAPTTWLDVGGRGL